MPSDDARGRLDAALRAQPGGLDLIDAACTLIDPDQIMRLRGDVGIRVRCDQRSIPEMDAANLLLGALLEEKPVCELRWLPTGLESNFVAATPAALSRLTFFALDLANSEIVTDQGRFAARIAPTLGSPGPDPLPATPAGIRTTKALKAERACEHWIRSQKERPASKDAAFELARAAVKTEGTLSRNAFDRAWANAALTEWKAAGRRKG
jgi:hypothetical protein